LAIRHGMPLYTPISPADRLDAKPLIAAHMYPVITMGEGAHPASRGKLLGDNPSADAVAMYSLDKHVGADTVPSFLCLAADDDVVPPLPNGIAMFGALQAAKIASELQVFEVGGHGFSLHWTAEKPCAAWPELFMAWAATHGFKA
jgi:acetyl esterase/lipase